MTREEAKEILTHNWTRVDNPNYSESELDEAFFMAIEALSQPIVAKCYEIEKDRIYCSPEVADKVFKALHEDTNVQNMHKGKWIKKQVFNPELDKYVTLIECSVCGYEPYFGGSESKFNYCANCGATMKGADNEINRCRCFNPDDEIHHYR